MNEPRVGAPSDDYRAVCSYSRVPGERQCANVAVLHLRVISNEWGEVFLDSCAQHAPVARAAGDVQQEHWYDSGACGLPGTIWHFELNRCVFDDSGVEPVAVESALVGAS